MNRTLCTLLLSAFFGFTVARALEPVDLSGVWKMDASRSESAAQAQPIRDMTLNIKQSGNTLTLETRMRDPKTSQIQSEVLTYKLDDTETDAAAPDGSRVVTKAHWDGSKLLAETVRNINHYAVKSESVYSLAKEELIVKTSLAIQHGYEGQNPNNVGNGTDVFVKSSR